MPVSRIHRTGSPYNARGASDLDFEQTADVIYLAHENHVPTKLIRLSHYLLAVQRRRVRPDDRGSDRARGRCDDPECGRGEQRQCLFPAIRHLCVTAYNEETGQESRASSTVSA
jgi:hypothetical protein